MSWLQSLPVIVLAVLVFIVPGLILSMAIRIRGINVLLLAPALTVGMAGFLAAIFPFAGVPWSPLTLVAGVIAISAVAWAIRRVLGRRWPDPAAEPQRRSMYAVVGLGALGSALLIALQMGTAMIVPDSISQTYDNVFHLNAVRWAMDSRNASPLNLGAFTGISAYPAGWHGMVSIVAQISGATIPVAVNATNIAIGSVIWPLSCLYLVQAVAGHRISTAVFSFLFAAGFSAFPILMIDWGVLYPNLLSISVLPAALGLAFTAMGLSHHHRQSSLICWLSLGVVVAGVALAHPSTFMAFLAFIVPAVLAVYVCRVRREFPLRTAKSKRRVIALTAMLVVGLVTLTVLWWFLRPPAGSADWGTVESPAQAVGEILLSAPMGRPAAVVIGVCTVVGIWRLITLKSRRWLVGMYAVAAIFFFLAASFSYPPRWFVTGVWYFDSYRLAALLPVATIGPAVIGAVYLLDTFRRRCLRAHHADVKFGRLLRWSSTGRGAPIMTAVGLVVLTLATQLVITTSAAKLAHWQYRSFEQSALLTPDERALLERLPSHVAPDAILAGLPSSGTSMAYAISGRQVIQPHILTTHGADVDVVNAGLKDAAEFPFICESVRRLNVKYVLDFGTRTVTGTMAGYGGVMDLMPNDSLELVDSEGPDARLFKVKACWR